LFGNQAPLVTSEEPNKVVTQDQSVGLESGILAAAPIVSGISELNLYDK
jgi:hypothetical protein